MDTKPHQGMVLSLHNYMKKDSWGEKSIGIQAENKLRLKKQPYNATSYASITQQQDSVAIEEEEEDSDSSFHTAPSSPETDVQDIEPGQITEPVSLLPDQLQLEYEALDKALKENEEREAALDLQIKQYRELQETIRIQLLEHKVRNSIARNRKPARVVDGMFSVSNDTAINEHASGKVGLLIPNTEQNVSSSTKPTSLLQKDKGKLRADVVGFKPVHNDEIPTMDIHSPFLSPTPKINILKPRKKVTGANAVLKGPEDPVKPLTPPTKRSIDVTESGTKKKKARYSPLEHGNRLIDAVIDKPFSARYALEVKDRPEINSDFELKETKRERKAREREDMISDSERMLVELDEPGYPGYCIQGRKELSRNASKTVNGFLNTSSLSLKEMRLILLNLKEASVEQNGRLTIEQEEFAKALIRKILQKIEAYMTLSDEAYSRSLRKQNPPPNVNPTLPDHYYGNIGTLDLSRPDLGHHELYKLITYFDAITNVSAKRKAQQLLLTSGRMPNQPILRTCDPAVRDDTDATLSQDETECARKFKMLKKEKIEKNRSQQEKSDRRKEKRIHSAEMKRERLEANRQVVSEIDQIADQIAMDMHINKKSETIASTALISDAGVPTCSEMAAVPKITSWKPKPENETVHALQFINPTNIGAVTMVEPVETASITNTNTMRSVSPVVNNNKMVTRNSPIVVADSPPTSPAAEAPIYREAAIKPTNAPVLINDNLISEPTIVKKISSNEDTSLKSQENTTQFQPYKSALNSLGLAHITPLPEPKSASLCIAESSGGVCKDRNCNFTHFSDYL
ncbi:hypothetical protein MFLAVUS_007857 [Mucor flavus]|uniref:Putative zinc-finger domain-containing protein n=1 Tax=Mucor flavus TaxID=439312 RepID=A0ABP9Z5G0_9FUNG